MKAWTGFADVPSSWSQPWRLLCILQHYHQCQTVRLHLFLSKGENFLLEYCITSLPPKILPPSCLWLLQNYFVDLSARLLNFHAITTIVTSASTERNFRELRPEGPCLWPCFPFSIHCSSPCSGSILEHYSTGAAHGTHRTPISGFECDSLLQDPASCYMESGNLNKVLVILDL